MSDFSNLLDKSAVNTIDRRSMRWVEPGFQKRYALLLLSIVALVGAVLVGTFWFHSQQVLNTLVNAGVVKQHSLYLIIERQMASLLWSVCAVVVLFAAFVFMMATFLSHRIVGPIFSVKRSLEAIGRNDLSGARIALRSDDEFQDVGDLVNKTVDRLESKQNH